MAIDAGSTLRAKRHRDQAERNQEFARDIVDDVPGWSTTVTFYAALHLVDEYAAALGFSPFGSHGARNGWLIHCKEMRSIGRQYDELRWYASIARYNCPPVGHDVRTPEVVKTRMFSLKGQVRRGVDLAMRKLES